MPGNGKVVRIMIMFCHIMARTIQDFKVMQTV